MMGRQPLALTAASCVLVVLFHTCSVGGCACEDILVTDRLSVRGVILPGGDQLQVVHHA